MTPRIVVADTETTGLDPAVDRVVEYAHVVLRPDPAGLAWLVGDRYSTICDPQRDIPPEAKAVHHITEAMVAGKPTIAAALAALDFSAVTHLAFHNAEFDVGFVGELLPKVPVICTWRVASHVYPRAPKTTNQVLRYWLNLQPLYLSSESAPHRASYDVAVTGALLVHLLEKLGLDEVVRLSDPKLPILQHVVRKTKYRGTDWSTMDAGFCKWVIKAQPPFDPDFLHTARYQLQWLTEAAKSPGNPRVWGEAL